MEKSAKDVVLAAYHYLADVTPPSQKISEVRIEEVKPYEDNGKDFWSVILSFDNIGDFPFDKKREYKVFRVQDTDGKVLSMEQIPRHE